MGILGWVVLGLVVGVLASTIMPERTTLSITVTTLIGVVGAVVGGYVGWLIFNTGLNTFFDLSTWILGLVGALVLLSIWRLVAGRRVKARA
ncbi:membrane protein (plasmid) [Pseudonocardia sp. EC080610-09]|uniref:GlsB/YeaQ/YmgE family stress response membrane protein n=1 Tax=unclassified Pseudonocardia TaxID=2619320 RepID=UPI000705DDC4|nr:MULTISPECIES: GlsB/YeaQ/YmgE family stress response membrane protein [unclassified Pseudonocardia]ALL79396.1 membrane protein [Pseudonocardia sp. EC080610-09]ALL85650.1 membrane protein [Pseudonocardia sp. EC080619-01]